MDEKPLLYKTPGGIVAQARADSFSINRTDAVQEEYIQAKLGAQLSLKISSTCINCKHLRIERQKHVDMRRIETVFQVRAMCPTTFCPTEFKPKEVSLFDEHGNLASFNPYAEEKHRNARAHAEYAASRKSLDTPESNVVAW